MPVWHIERHINKMSSIFDIFKQISQEKEQTQVSPITHIVAGLGNPEKQYLRTRHNAGFMFIDYISQKYNFSVDRLKFHALTGETIIGGKRILVMKPQTYINKSGVFFAGRTLGRNFRYSLTTYTPMYSDEYFKNLLRKSKKGLYNKYDRGLKVGVTSDNVRRFDKYAKSIYSMYTQLPDSLPDRVKKLAFSISQSYDNNYDKVKAIENYLVTNYPYTLLPNSTPPGRDFVDYFLFEQKQGYCSYYASAMAVMVRTLGIPARYVEGYILPAKSDTFSKYTVTNQQAHAWVEVYFEGFGWVTFEPTAPFNKAFYNKSEVKEVKFVENFKDDPAYRDYIKQLKAYDQGVEEENNKDALTKQILVITVIIFGVILLLIFAIYLYNLIVRRYRLYFVEKMSPRDCIINLMAYYMQIFALLGLPVKTGETPSEYGKRISAVLLYDRYAYRNEPMSDFLQRTANIEDFYKQSKFATVMDAFIMARYNPGEVTAEHKKTALAYYNNLMDKARVSMGNLRYYANKYNFGKFNFK
jgi:transglutaminase-like putative cysteine protease